MTKLYIYLDDTYDDKPENGDLISGRFYWSILDLVDGESLGYEIDGDDYTMIVIDTDDFKKITLHKSNVTFEEKPLYPVKKSKKKGG